MNYNCFAEFCVCIMIVYLSCNLGAWERKIKRYLTHAEYHIEFQDIKIIIVKSVNNHG